MLKRLSAALLLGGLLGLTPAAATVASARPTEVTESGSSQTQAYDLYHNRDDSHYRCSGYDYRCGDRYDRDDYRCSGYDYRCGDRYDGRRYGYHHYPSCGYRDRCYRRGYDDRDSAHASGGYDSHREHPRQ